MKHINAIDFAVMYGREEIEDDVVVMLPESHFVATIGEMHDPEDEIGWVRFEIYRGNVMAYQCEGIDHDISYVIVDWDDEFIGWKYVRENLEICKITIGEKTYELPEIWLSSAVKYLFNCESAEAFLNHYTQQQAREVLWLSERDHVEALEVL